eukprot:TRINITY_DN4355_c0_g1_i2.p1 TRINITY_DN4355_c0_g1~~TRINITY_DN4355_c0_g1_i2.p1  ORF type:complete len:153 (+),score=14.23 TRINITY_DN4355_c0_g1_i2:96-554(+)
MRHGKAFRRLGRGSSHRRALLRNLTTSLIRHERIRTTVAKAKELRRPAEKMITYAKRGTPGSLAKMESYLFDKSLVAKVKDELAPRYAERAGGYTRVVKAGFRSHDKAPLAYIEYVDNNLPPLTLTKEEFDELEKKLAALTTEDKSDAPATA